LSVAAKLLLAAELAAAAKLEGVAVMKRRSVFTIITRQFIAQSESAATLLYGDVKRNHALIVYMG